MSEFLDLIKNRRTIYGISDEQVVSDEKLREYLEAAIKHTPSAFNSQSSRVILLVGNEHKKLWDITLNKLIQIVPPENFAPTHERINRFEAGYGTILFFEDQQTIDFLQENFPKYAENFPVWSQQSSGMLQFVVWTLLENEGFGASLQHYNPLIDEAVSSAWNVPREWKLIAQMPFGKPIAAANEKSFLPLESRFKMYGNN